MSDDLDLPEDELLNEEDGPELPHFEGLDIAKLLGEMNQPRPREFKVHAAANEAGLEHILNKIEGSGFLLGEIIAKPTGGFTVVTWRMKQEGTVVEGDQPNQGEPAHEVTEESFQGDPPETI